MTTFLDLNKPYSSCEYKRVKQVRFEVLKSEDLCRYGVCKVDNNNIYAGGKACYGGLNDPRMAPIDPWGKCETCGGDMKECCGHFGYVELAKPMYNWGFLKTTVKCLRCVCHYCSKLLVHPNEHNLQNAVNLKNMKKRLQRVQQVCNGKKRCLAGVEDLPAPKEGEEGPTSEEIELHKMQGGCGYLQPRYYIENTVVMMGFPEGSEEEIGMQDRRRPLSAEEALNILSKISEEDKARMGFIKGRSDPAWLILTHFPIPPPPVRPSVAFGGNRSEDDVTMKLLDLVKANNMLKRLVDAGAGDHAIQEIIQLVQYHIYTVCDNNIGGIPQAQTKSKKPIKSIRERLKSKEGRLRGHLMGKRVDFSARTVIGGDPNLDTQMIGIPKSVALNMTFPERVTPHNFATMKKAILNGPSNWPGAKYIIRDDGARVDLRYADCKHIADHLQYGWRVERHMLDGDYVIFNRQPSLHKMSMMGHMTKILPWSTFRFNLSVTSPYNADFDGDEMNIHLAQSHETRAEIKHIMFNPRQIVSPQGNRPVMGIVQDSLLAVSKFTKRDTYLERDMAMVLLMWLPDWDGMLPTPAILKPRPLWTGKQIFSFLLPEELSLKKESGVAGKNKGDDPVFAKSDCRVIIRHGELVSGIVCKKTVGSSSGSLIHLIWNDYGPWAARTFLSYLQKQVNYWLLHNGFTIGSVDMVANDATLFNVSKTLQEAKREVNRIVEEAQKGRLETQPGKTMYQSFEAKVNQRLNAAREDAGKIGGDSLTEKNNIISMVQAGSKGSPINIAQIIACVGQQNVEGQRIRNGFRDRTLPHFTKEDYGPESRGFCENSYLAGLTPQETYFHAMGGREGVIDTACKTSETGYIQRRLVKSMETLTVRYDRTVRDDLDCVIQFIYGEDGMDAVWVEDQTIELMTMDHKKVEKTFRHDYDEANYGLGWIDDSDVIAKIKSTLEEQAILDNEYEEIKRLKKLVCTDIFPDGDSKQHLPVNIARLIERAKAGMVKEDSRDRLEMFSPPQIARMVNELMQDLGERVVRGLREGDTLGREVQENAMILMNAHLRAALGSRRVIEQEKLSKQSFKWLMGEVKMRFEKALAHAGESVGTIAAQSVGEPATQMTLNTFHFAGVGSKNVTLGVPRLKEIINVAKNVKTPSLTVFLTPSVARDQERAKDVQSKLEYTTLEKVTYFSQIFWDPDPTNTLVPGDREWVTEYYELPDEEEDPSRLSPWVLRIQLNNKVMTDKKLTIREVGESILSDFAGDLDCIFTDDNAEELVLRIRLVKDQAPNADAADDQEDKDFRFLKNIETNLLKEMALKGILGIKKVYMREDTVCKYLEKDGKFDREKEWVLDTDGVNLEQVMHEEEVDFKRTGSNDVVEIMQVLGVEAVRKSLLYELRRVISFDGSYVNYRHLATLSDVMAGRGHLMAVSRHGVNRTDKGPMMKCSFEETVEILMDAAMYAEVDYCRGVSENIILGQMTPIGTNMFDLYVDDRRDKQEDGTLGPSALERGTPVLPEKDQHQLVSFASPLLSPTEEQGCPKTTPYEEKDDVDLIGNFPSTLGNVPSPELTPGDDADDDKLAISPFSPAEQGFGGATSPFSEASPTSPGAPYTPTEGSPTTPHQSPTSPTYSVQELRRPTGAGAGAIVSPTYTARSPTYTPVAIPGSSSHRLRGAAGATSTSPMYTPRSMSSPGAQVSPTYSPTQIPGYQAPQTSPGYTPATPQHTPTSPGFSPSSPGYRQMRQTGSTSPASQAGLSPIYQGTPAGSADFPTSPSYTPHQGVAATPEEGRSAQYAFSEDENVERQFAAPKRAPRPGAGQQRSPEYSPDLADE